MLFNESFWLVFKGFIYALPFVILINYVLFTSLNKVLMVSIIMPYKELIVAFVFSLLIVYITMLKTHQKFKNKSVVELINNDNI